MNNEESTGEIKGKQEGEVIICALKSTTSATSRRAFKWLLRNPLGFKVSQVIFLHAAAKKKHA